MDRLNKSTMYQTTSQFYLLLLLAAMIMSGCQKEKKISPEEAYALALEKIDINQAVSYRYQTFWDNRFNESTYSDTAQIIYTKLEVSPQGFGFYINTGDSELIFEGVGYKVIRHDEQLIIGHNADDIKQDPDYFSSLMFFMNTPYQLPALEDFDKTADTLIGDRHFYVFYEIEERPSTLDSTQTIRSEEHYFLEPENHQVSRVKRVTMAEGDTTQVIDISFGDLKFDEFAYNFTELVDSIPGSYRETTEAAMDQEMLQGQIAVGDRLNKARYTDITGESVQIYGNPGGQTVVMFSFIGCGGCEYAMKEMNKENFQLKEGVKLYYSSHLDKKKILQKYLQEKGFPFKGFAAESNMNDDFFVFAFPTFVLIDEKGLVKEVIAGYTEEVKEMLF